ncbi:MAG TPA: hypothetical protein VFM14_04490 [Gemmatimonadales bacterium]|nr:hypothetical protein [Gemmatimonadales bacterium]
MPDEQIAEILGRTETAEAGCRDLVAAAREGGGTDNITVVVARMAARAELTG